jgi:hypothetical protein
MILHDSSYSDGLNFRIYINVVGDYYIHNNYSNNLLLYKHRFDINNKRYDNKEQPHIFELVKYEDKNFYQFVINFIKNKYSNQ